MYFAALPFLLLLSTKKIYTALKYAALFLALLAIQLWLVPLLPVSAGGIIYMFAVYIRKRDPLFYVRESAYFYHACQRIFSCGWKAPLAERVHDFSFYHSEVFSYDGGRMEFD